MEVKQFVTDILTQLDQAVDEAREATSRDINFVSVEGKRTVEFDIAVTADSTQSASGKAGIKVLSFAEAGGDISQNTTNSRVSRVQFGVNINPMTKSESARLESEIRNRNSIY